MGGAAMFEDVEALPIAQRERALDDGNRELYATEHGADMSGHVVRTFEGVTVEAAFLGDHAIEVGAEIGEDVGGSVLLNGKGRGGVLDEESEETSGEVLTVDPLLDFRGDVVETLALSLDGKLMARLPHSG